MHRRLAGQGPGGSALVTLLGVAVGALATTSACTPTRAIPAAGRPQAATPAASPGWPDGASFAPLPTLATLDPARFATPVVAQARRAGINPQLLMAILYNESYKPHDPAAERAWQRIDPNAAFGIANMHRAAFDDTKRGRDFAGRDWQELPDDPQLAIEAAAWYLHDLAARLPTRWPGPYTRDELLALGYNAGPGNMTAFANGARPGSVARSYLDRLRANWARAGQAVRHRN